MVSFWVAVILTLALAAFAIILNRVAPGQPRPWLRALIGLAPGVVGAIVVGTLTTDLVPDAFEQTATPWVVALATVGIIGLTVTSLARR